MSKFNKRKFILASSMAVTALGACATGYLIGNKPSANELSHDGWKAVEYPVQANYLHSRSGEDTKAKHAADFCMDLGGKVVRVFDSREQEANQAEGVFCELPGQSQPLPIDTRDPEKSSKACYVIPGGKTVEVGWKDDPSVGVPACIFPK